MTMELTPPPEKREKKLLIDDVFGGLLRSTPSARSLTFSGRFVGGRAYDYYEKLIGSIAPYTEYSSRSKPLPSRYGVSFEISVMPRLTTGKKLDIEDAYRILTWNRGVVDLVQGAKLSLGDAPAREVKHARIKTKINPGNQEIMGHIRKFFRDRYVLDHLARDLADSEQVMARQMRFYGEPIERVWKTKTRSERLEELAKTGELSYINFFEEGLLKITEEEVRQLTSSSMDGIELEAYIGKRIMDLAEKENMVEWYRCNSSRIEGRSVPKLMVFETDCGGILTPKWAWEKVVVPDLEWRVNMFDEYGIGLEHFQITYTGNKSMHLTLPCDIGLDDRSGVLTDLANNYRGKGKRYDINLHRPLEQSVWPHLRLFQLALALREIKESDLGGKLTIETKKGLRQNKGFIDWLGSSPKHKFKAILTPNIKTGRLARPYDHYEVFNKDLRIQPEVSDFSKMVHSSEIESAMRWFYETGDDPSFPVRPRARLSMKHIDVILTDIQSYVEQMFDNIYNRRGLSAYDPRIIEKRKIINGREFDSQPEGIFV